MLAHSSGTSKADDDFTLLVAGLQNDSFTCIGLDPTDGAQMYVRRSMLGFPNYTLQVSLRNGYVAACYLLCDEQTYTSAQDGINKVGYMAKALMNMDSDKVNDMFEWVNETSTPFCESGICCYPSIEDTTLCFALIAVSEKAYESVQNGTVLQFPPSTPPTYQVLPSYKATMSSGEEFVARWNSNVYIQETWPQSSVTPDTGDVMVYAHGSLENGLGTVKFYTIGDWLSYVSVSMTDLSGHDARALYLALLNTALIDLPQAAQAECADAFMAQHPNGITDTLFISFDFLGDGTIEIDGAGRQGQRKNKGRWNRRYGYERLLRNP